MLTDEEKQDRKNARKNAKEEFSKGQVNEVNQIFSDIAENPEKLSVDLAIEIYNKYFFKKDQIVSIYFSKLKQLHTWVEIFKLSGEADDSKDLAREHIKRVETNNHEWIGLYESEKDQVIREICIGKVSKNCHSLNDWIEVYEISSYGTEISKKALFNMKRHAKTHDDWRRVFKLAPFDTSTKNLALEMMIETAVPIQKKEEKKIVHGELQPDLNTEWKEEYEHIGDLYATHKDLALINRYITADAQKKVEKSDKI